MSDSLDIGVDVDSKEFVPAVADRKAGDRIANTRAGIAQWLNNLAPAMPDWQEATGRYYELLARIGWAGRPRCLCDQSTSDQALRPGDGLAWQDGPWTPKRSPGT